MQRSRTTSESNPPLTRRSTTAARELAAYLAHRRTTSTLRELATFFGLTHPDSMSNLTRRADKWIAESTTARKHISGIAELPVRYAIVRGNIRRCMLRRFPYGVYYHKTSEGIRILVIKHHSRHPDYGLDRE